MLQHLNARTKDICFFNISDWSGILTLFAIWNIMFWYNIGNGSGIYLLQMKKCMEAPLIFSGVLCFF